MKTYLLKRLLLIIPALLGIRLIMFPIIQLAPGEAGGAADTDGQPGTGERPGRYAGTHPGGQHAQGPTVLALWVMSIFAAFWLAG